MRLEYLLLRVTKKRECEEPGKRRWIVLLKFWIEPWNIFLKYLCMILSLTVDVKRLCVLVRAGYSLGDGMQNRAVAQLVRALH